MGSWQGAGGRVMWVVCGGDVWGGGGCLNVFDKGSHFLVSHFWSGG